MVIKLYLVPTSFTCGLQSGPLSQTLAQPSTYQSTAKTLYAMCIMYIYNATKNKCIINMITSYNKMHGPKAYQCFTENSNISHQCIVSALRWLVPRSMQTLQDLVANNHKWLSTEWNSSQQQRGLAACLFPHNTFSLHSTMYICNLTTVHVVCSLWCSFHDLL